MSYYQQPELPPIEHCLCGGSAQMENEQHHRKYPFKNADPNTYDGRPYTYYIRCQTCNMDTEAYKTKKQAINRWNNSLKWKRQNMAQQQQNGQYQQPQQQYAQPQQQQYQQPQGYPVTANGQSPGQITYTPQNTGVGPTHYNVSPEANPNMVPF